VLPHNLIITNSCKTTVLHSLGIYKFCDLWHMKDQYYDNGFPLYHIIQDKCHSTGHKSCKLFSSVLEMIFSTIHMKFTYLQFLTWQSLTISAQNNPTLFLYLQVQLLPHLCPSVQQCHHMQLPGHPMTATVLRDIIKRTDYVQANAVRSCTVLILLSLQE